MKITTPLVGIVVVSVLFGIGSSSCGGGPPVSFNELVHEYAYTTLSFSPVTATGTGYHIYNGAYLNELLDDYDPNSLDKQRKFFEGFRGRFSKIDVASLSPDDRADYDIINDSLTLQLAELNTLQNYKHNPT